MAREYVWRPSVIGRLLTGSPPWSLSLSNGRFELQINCESFAIDMGKGDLIGARQGFYWGRLTYPGGTLGGLPRGHVAGLAHEILDVCQRP